MEDVHKMSLLMDFYGHILPARQLSIMELYYENDLSLTEIAEQTGITRQGVYDHIRKAEHTLKVMEEKMMLVEKTVKVKAGIKKALGLINSGSYDNATDLLKEMLKERLMRPLSEQAFPLPLAKKGICVLKQEGPS
jgi:predicted DNA-binding protein YlxM (UPF0122 family)